MTAEKTPTTQIKIPNLSEQIPDLRNSSILIADDSTESLVALEIFLGAKGYRVDKANSGQKALKKALNNKYDLFLFNVQMSEMGGFELAEHLSGVQATRNIPIIFLTAVNIDEHSIPKDIQPAAVDYLLKPLDLSVLGRKVKNLLKLSYQQQAGKETDSLLEDGIKKRTTELSRKNKELEQFAYLAAHDLKAPVANLQSLLEIIDVQNGVKDKSKVILDKIIGCVTKLNRTIRSLNQVIEVKNNLNLKEETIDFAAILEFVTTGISELITEKNTMITSDFSQCSQINFSPVHLQSILQNLLTNSIKYARKDTAPKIDIKTINQNNYVCLVVRDNGTGIDMETNGEKLFELFQRFHLGEEGHGVGLHIVKCIVENYGGHIDVESEVNIGTTFKIYLKKDKKK